MLALEDSGAFGEEESLVKRMNLRARSEALASKLNLESPDAPISISRVHTSPLHSLLLSVVPHEECSERR